MYVYNIESMMRHLKFSYISIFTYLYGQEKGISSYLYYIKSNIVTAVLFKNKQL